jgi:hypothetical protein
MLGERDPLLVDVGGKSGGGLALEQPGVPVVAVTVENVKGRRDNGRELLGQRVDDCCG